MVTINKMKLVEKIQFRYQAGILLRKIRKKLRKKNARELQDKHLPKPKLIKRQARSGVTATENQLVASVCRESFYEFFKEFWSQISEEKLELNWHIEYLCDTLQLMAERVFAGLPKISDLAVNVPPGTTKSTIISVMYPIWCWIRMPNCQFIGASYSETLALDLSVKSRDIVESDKFRACFPEVKIRGDQNTKTLFKTTRNGWRYAVGVNGTVTGLHAHIIVIDDPLDPLKALSLLDLKKCNYWIDKQLSNRKVNKKVAPMILVMQRLHQDDPTRLFLRRGAQHICLPAEDQERTRPTEIKQYYVNGLLDPNRLDKHVLADEKKKGEVYYAGQFLQRPVPEGGLMFKTARLKIGTPPKQWQTMVRFWDKAGSIDSGAWTVGTLMGKDWDGRFWVLDVKRFRYDSFERENKIKQIAIQDGYNVIVGTEQEPGSGGKESAEATAKRLAGWRVRIIKVDKTTGGKVQRADPWSVQMNAGNVYLPEDCQTAGLWVDWSADWVEEHSYFPNSRYKDQVDSAALAFSLVNKDRVRVGGIECLENLPVG